MANWRRIGQKKKIHKVIWIEEEEKTIKENILHRGMGENIGKNKKRQTEEENEKEWKR